MVAFVGGPVTAQDMLDRWESNVGNVRERDEALDTLEAYVHWAATQKLGSVFAAVYDTSGVLVARKVADSIPTRRSPIPE